MLARIGLPVDLAREPLGDALRWIAYDKKLEGGALRFILVRAPGSLEIAKIAPAEVAGLLGLN